MDCAIACECILEEIGNYMHSLFPQDTSQATKATKSTKYLSIRQRIAKGKSAESRFSRCNQVRSKSSTTVHVHLENTIFEIERFRQNFNTKIEKYCMYIFFNRCENLVFFFLITHFYQFFLHRYIFKKFNIATLHRILSSGFSF